MKLQMDLKLFGNNFESIDDNVDWRVYGDEKMTNVRQNEEVSAPDFVFSCQNLQVGMCVLLLLLL